MKSAILDEAALLDQVEGDTELLRELVELFVEGVPEQVDAIQGAIARSDSPAVERSAHSLKGALSNLHAVAAADAARCLESMGREADLKNAPLVLDALRVALREAETALTAFSRQAEEALRAA